VTSTARLVFLGAVVSCRIASAALPEPREACFNDFSGVFNPGDADRILADAQSAPQSGAAAVSPAASVSSSAAAEAPGAAPSLAEAPPHLTPPAKARPAPIRRSAPHPSGPAPARRSSSALFGALPFLALLGLFVVPAGLIALIGFALYLASHRKRLCPNCRTPMVQLDEIADDMYLDAGQRLEESLHSIDYGVWKCAQCGAHSIERNARWFSAYSPCPICGYKTLSTRRDTLVPSTHHSTGIQRLSHVCRQCGHNREETVITPLLVEQAAHGRPEGAPARGDAGGKR